LSLEASLEISEIKDEDVEDIIQLWQRCDLLRAWNDPCHDVTLARRTPTSSILVGKKDGRIIASALAGFEGHRGWIYYVCVDPSVQRQGFGRAIMSAAEAWLRQRGAPKINLQVRFTNLAVLGFYDKLGYEYQKFAVMGKRI
jgi:ribosomal protein S18 acetylase RimI-like enzyme